METFDETKILLAIESMPDWKRVAFMVYCCERMLPNYRSFGADSGYGDTSSIRSALDAIWEWIATGFASPTVPSLALACEQQLPDTAEFSSVYTSAALDAGTATITVLEALTDASVNSVIEVASLARDTVDLFVQEIENLDPNATDLERKIIEHPLMQSELRTQRESLEMLKGIREDRDKACADLRVRWSLLTQGSLPAVT